MNTKDKKIMKQQVMAMYNDMMPELYRLWRQYTPIQIKTEVLSILSNHILSAVKDNCRKGAHRKLRFKQLKRKVEMLESAGNRVDELQALERSF